MSNARPGHFEFTRQDGIRFIADTHSPNGTPYHEVRVAGFVKCHGWMVTAHDDYWASVPVGRFETLPEVAAACVTFAMPDRAAA